MSNNVQYVCTVGGQSMRMQRIAPLPKHHVYYKGMQVKDWIAVLLPDVQFIGDGKSPSRLHTLLPLSHMHNVCIVDCDNIPYGVAGMQFNNDTVLAFYSDSDKYGHITLDAEGKLQSAHERTAGAGLKCSGVYFVRSMNALLQRMQHTPNSIAAAMTGADVLQEHTTVRIGDADDYYNALGLRWYDSCS